MIFPSQASTFQRTPTRAAIQRTTLDTSQGVVQGYTGHGHRFFAMSLVTLSPGRLGLPCHLQGVGQTCIVRAPVEEKLVQHRLIWFGHM
jgi:hypothetical protein